MRQLLNKKAYAAFVVRCRSAGLSEVTLARDEQGGHARLVYSARDPRTRRLLRDSWLIESGPQASEDERAFRELLARDFQVRSEAGGGGAAAAEAAPKRKNKGFGSRRAKAQRLSSDDGDRARRGSSGSRPSGEGA